MGFIKNYGLFFNIDEIFWGQQKNSGSILGLQADKKKSKPVDFRDQRGVYVLYAGYEIVYVGQVADQELIVRLRQHFKDDLAGRWDRFSWFGVRSVTQKMELGNYNSAAHVGMKQVLNHIEAILIYSAEPGLNRQGGRFGSSVKQFVQVRDGRLGPTHQEMIRELHATNQR